MNVLVCCRVILCLTGIGLSVYALHVELSKTQDDNYKALCDISEHMSCSKVFASKYGTGFGLVEPVLGKDSPLNIPNSIFGIVFYSLVCILGLFKSKFAAMTIFLFSVTSCIGSVYLGYILYFVLHDVCVVCISTYIVNGLLFIINFISLRKASSVKKSKRE
ncbi:vitamin K epoxide reductase complex subunit 1-like [Actinia tenebrosa]|uniref:vitamin-K-epoxide reductase (warfarin-sensitive) n=1 Tax=Actinia tenebrosa TaxID=6105 RepID=A0A6P8HXC4_ACTTE|nr:vitamin K epoxide reductase complex subunit 1-like [Actinia tenebrosa]